MIVHTVLFKWKRNVPKETIEQLMREIKSLKDKVGVIDILCGENFSKWNDGYTHAVVVLSKDKDGLETYRNHPEHQNIAKKIQGIEEMSIGVDFET